MAPPTREQRNLQEYSSNFQTAPTGDDLYYSLMETGNISSDSNPPQKEVQEASQFKWSDLLKPTSPTTTRFQEPRQAVSAQERQKIPTELPISPVQWPSLRSAATSKQGWAAASTRSWATIPSIREKYHHSPCIRRIRGLYNNGNTCFINVILQSLLSCEQFQKLALETKTQEGLIQKFNRLAREMVHDGGEPRFSRASYPENPLLPDWFFGIFPCSGPVISRRDGSNVGSQEDAEEFLSSLLNQLHEEDINNRERSSSPEKYSSSCNDGWGNSGIQGGRSADSSISKIFGGSLLNEVRKLPRLPSITEEPFFSLSLDIDSSSIDQAIMRYFSTEILEDTSRTGMTMQKQTFLGRTPKVLILHLKRFSFDVRTGGSVKVEKTVTFPELLHIPDSIRKGDQNLLTNSPRNFELAAVVTHKGRRLAGGHYVCNVRFRKEDGTSIWMNCNDSMIHEVKLEEVLQNQAYLLFYTSI